jgi:hypothetical protein
VITNKLNFVWDQFCQQVNGHQKATLNAACLTSFFFIKLLNKCNTGEYKYSLVQFWGKKVIGAEDRFPIDFDVILFLWNVPLHWYMLTMFSKAKYMIERYC